jgi:hypothetical protein
LKMIFNKNITIIVLLNFTFLIKKVQMLKI